LEGILRKGAFVDGQYLDATLMGMFRVEFYKFSSETGLDDNLR
jgi:hypothetical protein